MLLNSTKNDSILDSIHNWEKIDISLINYIITRGSSNVQKVSCATTAGLCLLLITNLNNLSAFTLLDLIYQNNKSYQGNFILYTLICGLIIYALEPIEWFWDNRKLSGIIKNYSFDPEIKILNMMDEFPFLKLSYNNFISNLYFLGSVLFLIPVVWFYGLEWFGIIQWLLLIGILGGVFSYLGLKARNAKATLEIYFNLTLLSYSRFVSTDNSKFLDDARTANWYVLRKSMISSNTKIIGLLKEMNTNLIHLTNIIPNQRCEKTYQEFIDIQLQSKTKLKNVKEYEFYENIVPVKFFYEFAEDYFKSLLLHKEEISNFSIQFKDDLAKTATAFRTRYKSTFVNAVDQVLCADIFPTDMKNALSRKNFLKNLEKSIKSIPGSSERTNLDIQTKIQEEITLTPEYQQLLYSLFNLRDKYYQVWSQISQFNGQKDILIKFLEHETFILQYY